jgi:hypothetical protein
LVKSGKYVSSGVIGVDDLVVASPAVDVWSLVCILYQLCNTEVRPLLQGGIDGQPEHGGVRGGKLVALGRVE